MSQTTDKRSGSLLAESPFVALRQEDSSWDYRGEFTKSLTHGMHSYPAMMIPQVARRLIESYSRRGETVLDPFCGSGSVLVEAQAAGRNSWGIDLNPVALMVARSKTTALEPELLEERLREIAARVDRGGAAAEPKFFNSEYWFKPQVAAGLARIRKAIDGATAGEPAIGEFFLTAFSETVRLSSNSRSHEFKLFRYAPERLAAHSPDPVALFFEKAAKNVRRMQAFCAHCQGSGCWCRPLLGDTTRPLDGIAEGSVDLVVTSPPYGDSGTTVAYGQFSRLSAQWLGFDEDEALGLDARLLGGRAAGSGRGDEAGKGRTEASAPTFGAGASVDRWEKLGSPSLTGAVGEVGRVDQQRGREVWAFYRDLAKALENVAQTVRGDGHLCIVVGNRRVKQVELPTDLIVAEMGAEVGLQPLRIIVRNIPSKTMPLRNSPTNVAGRLEPTMHKEYIVVLRKG